MCSASRISQKTVKVFWNFNANLPLLGERNYYSESLLCQSIIGPASLQVISLASECTPDRQNGKEKCHISPHHSLIHESSALSDHWSPDLFYFLQVSIMCVGVLLPEDFSFFPFP